jgi:hypothetical protein
MSWGAILLTQASGNLAASVFSVQTVQSICGVVTIKSEDRNLSILVRVKRRPLVSLQTLSIRDFDELAMALRRWDL